MATQRAIIKKTPLHHKALLLNLYISQYLGLGFFMESLVAILRKSGLPLEDLGLIYSLGLFMVLRFLWAPIIDKIRFEKAGHYRSWLLIWQSLMVVTLFCISLYDIFTQLHFILIGCVFFAFFAASQAIALDALAYKVVSKQERGMVNAFKIGGGFVGMFIGGGLVLIVYEHLGWFYSIIILSVTTLISLMQLLFFKEPKSIQYANFKEPSWKDFFRFWRGKEKRVWLILLLIYPICISSAYGLMTPILVDAGWRLDYIGLNINIFGATAGIAGAFTTGWLLKYFGRKKLLIWTPIIQSVGVLILLLPATGHAHIGVSIFAIVLIMFLYSPSATVLSTLMMDHVEHSPALEYAIQHCVFSFSGILSAGMAMGFAGKFGYTSVIVAASLFALGVSLFIFVVKNEVVEQDKSEPNPQIF